MMRNNELVRDRALYVHVRQMYNHVVSNSTPEIIEKFVFVTVKLVLH